MGERILNCREICPLPKDCADKVEEVNSTPPAIFTREKTIIQGGKIIGYTQVVVKKMPGRSTDEARKIASDGIPIGDSSVACPTMTEFYRYVFKKKWRIHWRESSLPTHR